MKIRSIVADDFDQLEELMFDHAKYEGLALPGGQVDLGRLHDLVLGQPPKIFLWVVEDGQGLGGYMSATIDYATWASAPFVYLDCLYLSEDMRGKGVGRRLVDTLKDFAQVQGINSIEWQTPPDNEMGIGFYLHIGATKLPKERFSLRINSPVTE
tara:strand:- start:4351 stop:4815 length:465 start_codon:yes stop_codon:yes gene_type:complete